MRVSTLVQVPSENPEHLQDAPEDAYAAVFLHIEHNVFDLFGLQLDIPVQKRSGVYYLRGEVLTLQQLQARPDSRAKYEYIKQKVHSGQDFDRNGYVAILIDGQVLPFYKRDRLVPILATAAK